MPLMLGISLDLFLVGRLILNNVALSGAIASTTFLVFFSLWYVFPWTRAKSDGVELAADLVASGLGIEP